MPTNTEFGQTFVRTAGVVALVACFASSAALAQERIAETRLDYGGGFKMGSLIKDIDSSLIGYGYNTGLVTGAFEPIDFAGGRGNLAFYGQFNNGWLNVDNNDGDSESTFSTNGAQVNYLGTRLRYDITPNWTIGARLEGSAAWNRSDILYYDADDDAGCNNEHPDRTVCLYAANFFMKFGGVGQITAGLGETASADIANINLGGIAYVTNANQASKFGDHRVGKIGWGYALVTPDIEGVERATLIRYDSPTIAGFIISASGGTADYSGSPYNADDYWDVALRYAGEFGAIRVAAGIGYQEYDRKGYGGLSQANVTGSASIMHVPTGIYLTGSATGLNADAKKFDPGVGETDSASSYYLQAGISQDFFNIGKTTLYGEYGETNSGANVGAYYYKDSSTSTWGVGVVQDIDAAAMSLYLTYNHGEAKFAGTEGDDMDAVMAGARIKF